MFKKNLIKFLKQVGLTFFVLSVIFISLIFSAVSTCSYYAKALSLKDFIHSIFGNQTSTQQTNMPNVYLGGIPLGFTLDCNGVVVIAVGEVHTQNGVVHTIISGQVNVGDVITHINNTAITSVQIIEDQMKLQEGSNTKITLDILDKDLSSKKAEILPAKDIITNKYKLGLWVRDNSAGVGTLTYVREDNLRFGALGHSVCDIDTGRRLPLLKGDVFKCNIIGVQASKKGSAGELKGLFLRNGTKIGCVDKNINCGVFGVADKQLVDLLSTKLQMASKDKVKTGRASIFCCVEGSACKEYSIEIIKTTRRSKDDNKSMIIRIIDEELINKTGGIVQGMSGSPIVQNGLLVGAVTHVFVSDPTKGYGIFAQTMLENGN